MTASFAPYRVLQVLEASLGGTRRYMEDLFEALGGGPQYGLAYSLNRADSSFMVLLERMRAAGWQLFEVDMRRSIDPRSDLSCTFALRKVFARFRPDIVHAHSSKAGAIARLATIGMRRRPGVVYSPNSIGVNISPLYAWIERLLALRADILSAVTPSEGAELRALKLKAPARIHVVVPTIRSDIFAPVSRARAREELGLPDGPLVVAIGRLAPQKDPLAFVDFVAALRERLGNARAIWVGDGDLRPAMEKRIAALKLQDALRITGWLDDVRPYVAASDLVVSTAAYESFGYATAEALAMDRPVVASAITGTVDVVTTDTGDQLYSYRDIDSAVSLAARLLCDREHAAEVAARGRERVVATFSSEQMRNGLAGAYAAAVNR
jgi:glycosyltransferase involved in cell wall biosynthesis